MSGRHLSPAAGPCAGRRGAASQKNSPPQDGPVSAA